MKKRGKPDDGCNRPGPRNANGALPRRGFKIDARRLNGKVGKAPDSKRPRNDDSPTAPGRKALGKRSADRLGVDEDRKKSGECDRRDEKAPRQDAEPS